MASKKKKKAKKNITSEQPAEVVTATPSAILPTDNAPTEEPTAEEELVAETPQPEPDTELSVETVPPEADTPDLSQSSEEDSAIEPAEEAYASLQSGAIQTVRFKKVPLILIIGVVVLVAIVGVYLLKKPSNPLPASVTQKVTFSVYYPKPNSSGYGYSTGSGSYAAGKLSYSLVPKNTTRTEGNGAFVRVSETAIQGQGPDLHLLPNFSVFQVPAGEAAVSPDGQVINGVIVTKKTMIILNGLGGVRRQDLIQIMNSM